MSLLVVLHRVGGPYPHRRTIRRRGLRGINDLSHTRGGGPQRNCRVHDCVPRVVKRRRYDECDLGDQLQSQWRDYQSLRGKKAPPSWVPSRPLQERRVSRISIPQYLFQGLIFIGCGGVWSVYRGGRTPDSGRVREPREEGSKFKSRDNGLNWDESGTYVTV